MAIKIRASKISIESTHPNKDVWIHIVVQQIIYNNNKKEIVNIIPSYDRFSKPLSRILTMPFAFKHTAGDTVMGYEVMQIITEVVVKWLKERYDVEEDAQGDLWVKE